MKSLSDIFEKINDYRDTIFYSFSAVLFLVIALLLHNIYHALFLVGMLPMFRELSRSLAWLMTFYQTRDNRTILYMIMANCIQAAVGLIWAIATDVPNAIILRSLYPLISLPFFIIGIMLHWPRGLSVFGKIEIICKLWWICLFDYPRKNEKPPKKKKEAWFSKKLAQLVEDMKDWVSPVPEASPSREIIQ